MRKRRSDFKPRIQCTCAHCGASFEETAYRLKNGHGTYCSKPCSKLGRRKRVSVNCAFCTTLLDLWPCEVMERNFCSRVCTSKGGVSAATRLKQSKIRRGRPAPWVAGKNCHFWRGGITEEHKALRMSLAYRQWRTAVFTRDDYTCQACKQRGVKLQADHELPFSLYPDLRFEVLNGRTLCIPCHKKTPTYGRNKIAEYEGIVEELGITL